MSLKYIQAAAKTWQQKSKAHIFFRPPMSFDREEWNGISKAYWLDQKFALNQRYSVFLYALN